MDDLDDLLDNPGQAPAPAAPIAGFDDDDDLLGGPPVSTAVPGFDDDDDLLGGPAPASPPAPGNATASPTKTDSAPSQPGSPATPGVKYAGAPLYTGPERPTAPLSISPISHEKMSEEMRPYLTPNTYYARFVQVIDKSDHKQRRCLLVMDTKIAVLNPDFAYEREIAITKVIGVLSQTSSVSKAFVGREVQQQYLIQIDHGDDLLISCHRDGGNAIESVPPGQSATAGGTPSDSTSTAELNSVLSAVCSSFGVVLPVAVLTAPDSLHDHVKKVPILAPKMRRSLAESLAFRSELRVEQQELERLEGQLQMNIASLTNSANGQQVSDLLQEIGNFESQMIETNSKISKLEEEHDAIKKAVEKANRRLTKERKHREEVVKARMQEAEAARLLQKTAEYEVKKHAHAHEMEKIATVTHLYEEWKKRRTHSTYDMRTLPDRMDELDSQLESVMSKLNVRSDDSRQKVKALTENRRRTKTCEGFLATLKQHIHVLETTELGQQLAAEVVNDVDIPDINPVLVHTSEEHPPSASPTPGASPQHKDPAAAEFDGPIPAPGTAGAAPEAKGPAIELNDSFDLSPKAAPVEAAGGAGGGGGGGAPPVIDLDDDDDDLPIPVPAAKPPTPVMDDI